AKLTVDGLTKGPRTERFDRPGRNPWKDEKGFRGPNEIESPTGQWNLLEILCDGDKVEITVNGHKTLTGTNAIPQTGKILVQSEGAEIFFRRLDLYPLPKAR
ncbi:MAG: family 16 glycoside hydrolase, partial [Limisphaerales bacterium]